MATQFHLVINGPKDLLAYAQQRLIALEQTWSRFLSTSEISRLNANLGRPLSVSADTLALVDAMHQAWRLTAGRFDPTQLPALLAAGYTTSIDDPLLHTSLSPDIQRSGDLDALVLNYDDMTVTLPQGIALDPGGIGKGLAADLIATEVVDQGATGAIVNIGGDLRLTGQPPEKTWTVAIENPINTGHPAHTLAIDAGGIATSSTLSRRLGPLGKNHHHIDPTTGLSAETDIATVTVIAQAAWLAEIHATAALIVGAQDALSYLEGHSLEGVIIALDGKVTTTQALAETVAN